MVVLTEKSTHKTDFRRQMEFQQVQVERKNPKQRTSFSKGVMASGLSRACSREVRCGRSLAFVREGGGRHRQLRFWRSDFVKQTVRTVKIWGSAVSDLSADLGLVETSDEVQVLRWLASLGSAIC